jgi:hypothetical protein
LIGVRLHKAELARLDAWIAAQNDEEISRPEALRRLAAAVLDSNEAADTQEGRRAPTRSKR